MIFHSPYTLKFLSTSEVELLALPVHFGFSLIMYCPKYNSLRTFIRLCNLSNVTVNYRFGCIIAWVANTHISNNVNEASRHIQWTVNVTENFTKNIEDVST